MAIVKKSSAGETWQVVRDRNGTVGMVEVVGSQMTTIVGFTVANNVTPQRALLIDRDAKVISAAPEMLAALEAIVGEAGFEGLPEHKQDQVCAAIEKATN